jgi:hypothetical protein
MSISLELDHIKAELKMSGWVNSYGECIDEKFMTHVYVCRRIIDLLTSMENKNKGDEALSILTDILDKMVNFLPVTPLRGEDDEWDEISPGNFRNKRYPDVIKTNEESINQSFDTARKVFCSSKKDAEGKEETIFFTNHESSVPITFPYMPEKEYVEVK